MFHFKHFSLFHEKSTLKIGTDSVLLASLVNVNRATTVLDIGCGCGVIAFCVAFRMQQNDNNAKQSIVGIDIDEPSIREAEENLTLFPKKENQDFLFLSKNITDFAKSSKNTYHLIVSNPPFFHNDLKPQHLRHRLSKHADGNLHFETLIQCVDSLLMPNGTFYLILPEYESRIFTSLTTNILHLAEEISIFSTPSKSVNRKILAFRKESNEDVVRSTLCIRDSQGQFTEEYKIKTNDFYLAF